MTTREELVTRIEELEDALVNAESELADLDMEPVDVTDEVEVKIGRNTKGEIRAYFTHNGDVIVRAGMEKGAELTSFGENNGYAIVAGEMGKRGAYFKVFHTNND